MIDLILAGKKDVVSREHAGTSASLKEILCPSETEFGRPLRGIR